MTRPSPKIDLSRTERHLGTLAMSVLVVLLVLFYLIRIDGAVIAAGQAVVRGKPKPVQSLDGGVAREILVADGDAVTSGQVLIRLDSSLLDINRDILRSRLAELTARRARLEAEEQGLASVTTPAILDEVDAAALQGHLAGQREIFMARRTVLAARRDQLIERVHQYESQIAGLEAQIEAAQSRIELLSREAGKLADLNARGLAPESRLRELQGRLAALHGDVAVYQSDLAGKRNAIRDAELQIIQAEREFREQVATDLRDVTAKIEESRLELAGVESKLAQLEIRAPVDGIVHEMQVTSAGGVVPPQETVLTIVPVGEGVEFDLQVRPDQIDSVYEGQVARVRFPAFSRSTTPDLFGRISKVAPDSVFDRASRRSFYRIEVTVPAREMARLSEVELVPGMPVEAFLQTGDRSILSYLVKPITDHMMRAFREG